MLGTGWTCSSEILQAMFIVNYRTRITELRQKGNDIESRICLGKCGRSHVSGMHQYRIKPKIVFGETKPKTKLLNQDYK